MPGPDSKQEVGFLDLDILYEPAPRSFPSQRQHGPNGKFRDFEISPIDLFN